MCASWLVETSRLRHSLPESFGCQKETNPRRPAGAGLGHLGEAIDCNSTQGYDRDSDDRGRCEFVETRRRTVALLAGGGVDGAKGDVVGTGFERELDFVELMGRDPDQEIVAEPPPQGCGGHTGCGQMDTRHSRTDRNVCPAVDEEPARRRRRLTSLKDERQEIEVSEVFLADLNRVDAGVGRLPQPRKEILTRMVVAVSDRQQTWHPHASEPYALLRASIRSLSQRSRSWAAQTRCTSPNPLTAPRAAGCAKNE